MRFIGADLHKKTITFCVVEVVHGKTRLVERKRIFCRETARIENFLAQHAPCRVVVERVRRRLGAAAKISGKQITVKRFGDEVYFWLDSEKKKNRKSKAPSGKRDTDGGALSSESGHNGFSRDEAVNARQ